jgi:hypothetical protein
MSCPEEFKSEAEPPIDDIQRSILKADRKKKRKKKSKKDNPKLSPESLDIV